MLLTTALLDSLTEQAKASPRLRMHFDLRDTPEDASQRILNAMEPGTRLPIHRHRDTSETVVMLRGKAHWNYYDAHGTLTESFLVCADGDIRGLSVPKGQWHNTECLESGTVILECKNGPWKPLAEEDILDFHKNSTR